MKTTVERIVIANREVNVFECSPSNAKLAFRLARFLDKTNPTAKTFNKSNEDLIVKKYGEKIEDTDNYKVPEDKMEAYQKEINEILSQEEEMDYTISLSLFEGENVSKEFFIRMGDFIVE